MENDKSFMEWLNQTINTAGAPEQDRKTISEAYYGCWKAALKSRGVE